MGRRHNNGSDEPRKMNILEALTSPPACQDKKSVSCGVTPVAGGAPNSIALDDLKRRLARAGYDVREVTHGEGRVLLIAGELPLTVIEGDPLAGGIQRTTDEARCPDKPECDGCANDEGVCVAEMGSELVLNDALELAGRLADAWGSAGEYADADLDILRGLCGEAKQAVDHLASLVRSLQHLVAIGERYNAALVREASRRDEKWMAGINSIAGFDLSYDDGDDAAIRRPPTLREWIEGLRKDKDAIEADRDDLLRALADAFPASSYADRVAELDAKPTGDR